MIVTIENLTKDLVALPTGSTVLAINNHGASNWARTARVNTRSIDGVEKSYFLKVAQGNLGGGMMLGEFESMAAIYNIVPTFVPRPIAWGTSKVLDSGVASCLVHHQVHFKLDIEMEC
jgi:protein-ribulosamine 3-kinase